MTTQQALTIPLMLLFLIAALPAASAAEPDSFHDKWDTDPALAINGMRDRSARQVAVELLSSARKYRKLKEFSRAESAARAALVFARSADKLQEQLGNLDPELVRNSRYSPLLETVYVELIGIIREQNLPGRTFDAYGEAISDIDTPYLYFRRAMWQADRGNLPAAIDDMSSAEIGYRKHASEETDPLKQRWLAEDANEATGWRGHFHSLKGDYKQALVDIDIAMQNEHNKGRWLAYRALTHARAGNLGSARSDAELAILELEPDTLGISRDPRVRMRAEEAADLIDQMRRILRK